MTPPGPPGSAPTHTYWPRRPLITGGVEIKVGGCSWETPCQRSLSSHHFPNSWNQRPRTPHYKVSLIKETGRMAGRPTGAEILHQLDTLFRVGVVGDLSDGQ